MKKYCLICLAAAMCVSAGLRPAQAQALPAAPNAALGLNNAVLAGNVELVRRMLEADSALAFQRSESGDTPLHWAALSGNIQIASLLLSMKADINAKTKDGWTPLHWATLKGRAEMIVFLLENGADIEAQTREQWTPLHVAAYQEDRAAIELLLLHGANPEAKDVGGLTPRETFLEKCRPVARALAPAAADKDMQQLAEEGVTASEKISRLESKLRELFGEHAALQKEAAELREALKKIKPGPSPAELENLKLREELDAAETKIKSLENQILTLEKKNEHLAEQLAAAEAGAASAEGRQSEVEELKLKISAMNELLKDNVWRAEQLYTQLVIANKERAELQAKLAAYESSNR